MDNSTSLTFTMTAYAVMEKYKYWMVTLFLLLYLLTLSLNMLLITVVYQQKELHQPMTILSCMLSINELYGGNAMFPSLIALLLSKTYEINSIWCKTQVYFLHTYACTELCILAVMGYDRYVAICNPLQYHSIMSNSKAVKLSVLALFYALFVFGCFYSLTLRLTFCGKTIPKLYCVNMELVKNSCTAVSYISIVGLVLILLMVVPQFIMVIFSYVQIAKVCQKLSRESQFNALKTCIPHLLSVLNYTIAATFEIVQSRFDMRSFPSETRIFMSVYFLVIPTVTNPVMYGLGTQILRVHILKLLIRSKILPTLISKAVAVV